MVAAVACFPIERDGRRGDFKMPSGKTALKLPLDTIEFQMYYIRDNRGGWERCRSDAMTAHEQPAELLKL
jgi:hypothetical protein